MRRASRSPSPRPSRTQGTGRSRRHRAGLVAVALGLVMIGVPAPGDADVAEPAVLDRGDITAFDVSSREGAPVLEVRRGDASWVPEDVLVRADGDQALHELPEQLPPRYAEVLEPGSTVYQLPAGGADGVPGLGWGTRRLAAWSADRPLAEAAVTLELSATGPGRVVAFSDPGDGRRLEVHLDSASPEPGTVSLGGGEEATPTWVFARPGSYTVHARPTVHLADGQALVGAVSAYQVEVAAPFPTEPPVVALSVS